MNSLPGPGKNGWLGVMFFERQHDPVRIHQRLAAVQRQGRHHQLTGGQHQFLALDVIHFDGFVIEALVIENFAHLGAKRAGGELVQAHHDYLCA